MKPKGVFFSLVALNGFSFILSPLHLTFCTLWPTQLLFGLSFNFTSLGKDFLIPRVSYCILIKQSWSLSEWQGLWKKERTSPLCSLLSPWCFLCSADESWMKQTKCKQLLRMLRHQELAVSCSFSVRASPGPFFSFPFPAIVPGMLKVLLRCSCNLTLNHAISWLSSSSLLCSFCLSF